MRYKVGSPAGRPDWANFRPLGCYFLWAVYFRISEAPTIFCNNFFPSEKVVNYYLFLNLLGYILGDFFTTASGHPAPQPGNLYFKKYLFISIICFIYLFNIYLYIF
jgi:hypothetical protein